MQVQVGETTEDSLEKNAQSLFLEPPEGYGIVTDSISRCGPIVPANISFLTLYPFKTVLFLREDSPNKRLTDFMNQTSVKFTRIPIYTGRAKLAWRTQLDELVKLALEFILDADNYPILVSSASSLHLCTVFGCLRRMQGWPLSSIMGEFRRFTPEGPVAMYKTYVEMFDFDLINIPEHSPLRSDGA